MPNALEDNQTQLTLYDSESAALAEKVKARMVVTIVWGGDRGTGVGHKLVPSDSLLNDAYFLRDAATFLNQFAYELFGKSRGRV